MGRFSVNLFSVPPSILSNMFLCENIWKLGWRTLLFPFKHEILKPARLDLEPQERFQQSFAKKLVQGGRSATNDALQKEYSLRWNVSGCSRDWQPHRIALRLNEQKQTAKMTVFFSNHQSFCRCSSDMNGWWKNGRNGWATTVAAYCVCVTQRSSILRPLADSCSSSSGKTSHKSVKFLL